MPFEILDDVHITKAYEPLILENYKLCSGDDENVVMEMKRSGMYWKVYQERYQKFLKLHNQLRDLLRNKEKPSQRLWDEYSEAKEDVLTAQEIINEDYQKYAE